ncbi:MAG: hypothetical protein RBR37_08830 [Advenella sp.]|nr:hypothetical protein [Advenella sp.]
MFALTQHKRQPKRLTPVLLTGLLLTLSACSTYRDIPPNSPISQVENQLGTPNYRCTLPDGRQRLVWSQQPQGQYAYGANVNQQGNIDKVQSLLTDSHFRRLNEGHWTQSDVACEFGPPAEIDRVGLGEKNEVVWTYRYKQSNAWNSLMFVYFGRNGDAVTHYHSGPDLRYERWFND